MKIKALLIISFFYIFTSFSFSQTENTHPEKFKYKKVDKPKAKILGWESIMNNYVVIKSLGSAGENYDRVLNFLKLNLKNYEQAIETQTKNKFIRIRGIGKDIYLTSSFGLTYHSYDVRYTMTIFFKENRMKVEINSMEYAEEIIDPDRYKEQIKITTWNILDKLYLHKSNGKPKKSVYGKSDILIENYFNGIIDSFLKFSNSMKENSDW